MNNNYFIKFSGKVYCKAVQGLEIINDSCIIKYGSRIDKENYGFHKTCQKTQPWNNAYPKSKPYKSIKTIYAYIRNLVSEF